MSSCFFEKVEKFEIGLIKEAVESHGTVSDAARFLRMKRTTLVEKMKRYGLRHKLPPKKRMGVATSRTT